MSTAGEGDPAEKKRLLELVAFAQRDQGSRWFTWRQGVLCAIALISFFTALRTWTTWRSFHRPVEVHAESGISRAEQDAMIVAIRFSSADLDPVAMDAATFQSVFLGRGRIERSAGFVRQGREARVTVRRRDGSPGNARFPYTRIFTFDETGRLTGSELFVPARSIICF